MILLIVCFDDDKKLYTSVCNKTIAFYNLKSKFTFEKLIEKSLLNLITCESLRSNTRGPNTNL